MNDEEKQKAKAALVEALAFKPLKLFLQRPLLKRLEKSGPVTLKTANLTLQEAADEIFLTMEAWILRGANTQVEMRTVEYPATWWEHLKQTVYDWRWIPEAILQKFPVRMHVEEVPFEQALNLCPHVSYPEGSKKHVEFMLRLPEVTREALELLGEFELKHVDLDDGDFCPWCEDEPEDCIHVRVTRFMQRNGVLLEESNGSDSR